MKAMDLISVLVWLSLILLKLSSRSVFVICTQSRTPLQSGGQFVLLVAFALLTNALFLELPVGSVVILFMLAIGMKAVYWFMSLHQTGHELDLFFFVLELSGISIAFIGWQREHWLARKRK